MLNLFSLTHFMRKSNSLTKETYSSKVIKCTSKQSWSCPIIAFGDTFFLDQKREVWMISGFFVLFYFRFNGWVAGVRRGCYGINGTGGGKKRGAGVTLEPTDQISKCDISRHASISSTSPCQSVVGNSFEFPCCLIFRKCIF